MRQQQKSDKTRFQKGQSLLISNQDTKVFNALDSSFSQFVQQNYRTQNSATQEVLRKVSQTIVRVHSNLLPKTQKLQIFRDLSRQQHQLLQRIKNDSLTHTIYAGVLAIESCLKQMQKEQNSVIGRVMKGVGVMLRNFKVFQVQFNRINSDENDNNILGKSQQSMYRLYDSLKLFISQLHKLPAIRMRDSECEKHFQIIKSISITDEMLLNKINKDENLLFSLLVQQNNHQRITIVQLQKKIGKLQVENNALMLIVKEKQSQKLSSTKIDSHKVTDQKPKILLQSPVSSSTAQQQNPNNQTASQSRNTHDSISIIKQLNQQLIQKNQTIKNMNYQFTIEIDKYSQIFTKIEQQNKQLFKKCNHYSEIKQFVKELEYEIMILKQENTKYKMKFNHLLGQINTMANGETNYYNNDPQITQSYTRNRIDTYNTNQQRTSRCPSLSPKSKQQQNINRYFSPNNLQSSTNGQIETFQYQQYNPKKASYKNINNYQKQNYKYKRDSSPTFGSPNTINQRTIQTQQERLSSRHNYRTRQQPTSPRFDFPQHIIAQTHKSRQKQNPMKTSQINKNQYQINSQLKQQMKRSKFINQNLAYL